MPRGPISEEQKAAMQLGRKQAKVVSAYLDAFESQRPKRGRKRTEATITTRLAKIDEEFEDASPVKQLQFIQERMDLAEELEAMKNKPDLSALEDEFVKVAKEYGERNQISYAAWREFGVTAELLKRAGISRSS